MRGAFQTQTRGALEWKNTTHTGEERGRRSVERRAEKVSKKFWGFSDPNAWEVILWGERSGRQTVFLRGSD